MKILAVDDDPSIRDLLPMILAEAGFTHVTAASSALDALSVIAKQAAPFECFLLDIQMPGVSGIELCGAIRELPEYGKAPIIMLTAMHEKSFIDKAFAAGATDYATKPFDIIEICARVRMAKLLVDEQRQAWKRMRKAGQPDKAFADRSEAEFSKAANISGVKGLISKQAIENYIAQLSRAGVQSSTFFAVHVQNGECVFAKCRSSEFEYVLRHVADAITASKTQGSVIMCYTGSGNFICCSNAATFTSHDQVETAIQEILHDKDLTHDDGSPLDVEIAVGAAVEPLLSETLSLEDLEPQAVKRVMARVKEKRSAPAVLNIRRIPF